MVMAYEDSLRQRRHFRVATDAGFTLIELMVVLLILAILLAIAIPTFLGVTNSANNRAAQSNLNTAMINAKAAYQSNGQTYAGVNVATLSSSEPSLNFIQGTVAVPSAANASSNQAQISVFTATDGNSIVISAYSVKTKNCWVIEDNPASEASITTPYATATSGLIGSGSTFPVTDAKGGSIAAGTGTFYYKFANVSATTCNAGNFGVAYSSVLANGFPS